MSDIYDNVAARGYRDGWTLEQFIARQICKAAGEEMKELAEAVTGGRGPWRPTWVWKIVDAGFWCRQAFDDPGAWAWTAVDLEKVMAEIVDVYIPLKCIEVALNEMGVEFDLDEAALEKSAGDVKRGVRGK